MSIFTFIRGKLSNDLYIQVWENRIKVSNIQSKEVYDQEPLLAVEVKPNGAKQVVAIGSACKNLDKKKYIVANPFSHPRVLLADFYIAEKVLQHVVKEMHTSQRISPAPRIIFQPMEKTEGGLSSVEERAFRELCVGAGAREVIIYTGNELSLHNLDFDKIK
ncbi:MULTISPECIES: rod shape-determining protein [Pseudoalteromonas]|uniref:Rod shape-determining protein n=1 Tax=Pseudoalteromonas obscura TaxID=3048491 RepID=A0ABT7EP44_9GAMM|nr:MULTISPECIES: rod shape-determining protein [Pseudoalteromonas]MBQ4834891.1 rod shape-determining protein [Pseudoalteromonas luteoviolacea]MDK2596809.1 rod shape-determining protein [Pseudoalteromonas sp. P94(2023)]